LGYLNLNGNGEEEEYDMVDDSDDPAPNGRNAHGKNTYMSQLQEVANRERDEVVIDLNDLDAVSGGGCAGRMLG
jgi:DNA replication licensing factor MCM7